jgi:phosphinothricin acetyltransferase
MEIRLASVADADSVHAIYAQYCSTPITFELEPPGVEEMRRRIEHTLIGYPWLVAVEAGSIVGYAYGHTFRERPAYRWSVETSVYVDERHHRQGVGPALYDRLLKILAAQGFITAVAGITLPNPASEKLHKAFGFKPAGVYENIGFKNGQWHAVGMYTRPLNACHSSPAEPISCQAAMRALQV